VEAALVKLLSGADPVGISLNCSRCDDRAGEIARSYERRSGLPAVDVLRDGPGGSSTPSRTARRRPPFQVRAGAAPAIREADPAGGNRMRLKSCNVYRVLIPLVQPS